MVREAIVNAVAHRDYALAGAVQVSVFADRVEVWNPGVLPPPLTPELLRKPHGSCRAERPDLRCAVPGPLHREIRHRHADDDP